jgi:hypothetical protein
MRKLGNLFEMCALFLLYCLDGREMLSELFRHLGTGLPFIVHELQRIQFGLLCHARRFQTVTRFDESSNLCVGEISGFIPGDWIFGFLRV